MILSIAFNFSYENNNITIILTCQFLLQKKETRLKIARSLSMPANNNKDKSIRRMDSFFRVVPSTTRVKEGNESLSTSPTKDTGIVDILLLTLASAFMKNGRILFSNFFLVQKSKMMVKIYLKKRRCVEFVWLNYVKEVRPSSWNVAVKVNLLWLTKNVLLNGLV